jgi:hypothetical protein
MNPLEAANELEQKADKWYNRLDKKPHIIYLGFSLFFIGILCYWIYRKDVQERKDAETHRTEIIKKDVEIAQVRADNKVLLEENRQLRDRAETSNERTIWALLRGGRDTSRWGR